MGKQNNPPRPKPLTKEELDGRMGDELIKFSVYEDRELAIIGPAILDDLIREMLRSRFIDDADAAEEALDRDFQSASRRITLAYLVGIIPLSYRDGLRQINAIRNRFAHYHVIKSFEDPAILEMTRNILTKELAGHLPDPIPRKEGRDRFRNAVVSFVVLLPNIHNFIERIPPRPSLKVPH